MPPPRSSLFCAGHLAERIEQAEAALITRVNDAARRRGSREGFLRTVAGGVASFADHGSPFNKVAGLGFRGLPDLAELAEIEQVFARRCCPVQVELAHLAEPAVGQMLTERGYRLVAFENVLGRRLGSDPLPAPPDGTEARRSGADEFDAWLGAVTAGFARSDDQGAPSHETFDDEVLANAERDFAG